MADVKKTIKAALEQNQLAAAAQAAAKDHTAISALIRLSYDRETVAGWRAILAIGMAARELAGKDREFLRNTCRKLLWSLNDESGGIGWSAPELLGEIVSADPGRFADIVPLIAEAYHIEGGMFKAGVVYALSRIGAHAPELAALHRGIMDDALGDHDPLVRIRALDLAGIISKEAERSGLWTGEYAASLKHRIREMTRDRGEAWIYIGDDFTSVQAGEKAKSIIKSF